MGRKTSADEDDGDKMDFRIRHGQRGDQRGCCNCIDALRTALRAAVTRTGMRMSGSYRISQGRLSGRAHHFIAVAR
jgi:hypothetical protein